MTAVWITAIIAIALVANSIVVAIRDVAKTKRQASPCEHCSHDADKEQS
ncbi:hypothetical protein M2155_000566 [Streptomyces sp. SAI-119]|nr:hypothetical protein [Streptomyces sp. SAI-119]MDH6448158.1 hypothetical protein [Streptomyces sp. SAI-119]